MRIFHSAPDEWDCEIPLSRIKGGGVPLTETFALPMDGAVEYWGQFYQARGPLTAVVTASHAGESIVVRVEAAGDFTVPCSRCLEETSLAIRGDMRYLFSLRRMSGDGGKDGSGRDEDAAGAAPDGEVETIGIDGFRAALGAAPYIWETLILNLPERVLCAEDCRGLCPVCGCDRNKRACVCENGGGDPRMEVLRELLN